jgi:hypothetical protein
MEMFDEWNGTGSYHNRPIVGGIAELNHLYKSQWRKEYNGAKKKPVFPCPMCLPFNNRQNF